MEETVTWRIFGMYMLVIFFMLLAGGAFAQMKVIQFNAGWNKANEAPWVNKLEDCNTIASSHFYSRIISDKHGNLQTEAKR